MALLNYTTIISPEQSIGELQKMLSQHGVQGILTEYEGPNVSVVSFRIMVSGNMMDFRLPCNHRGVRTLFDEQGIRSVKHKDRNLDNQAVRTAWRIIVAWVEAQLALVEVNMVTLPEVFLPYAVTKSGETLGQRMLANPQLLLGNGKP